MQVNLNWTAPVGSSVVRYDIYRAANGGSFSKIGESLDVSFVDATVSEGNAYSYTVRAINLAGSSANSNVASTPSVPSAPTGLTVVVTA